MEISKFIEFFAELFDETDVNVFTKETEFKKLEEWSSLMALSVIAMVDEEYGITIQGEDIRNANTIADLFDNVKVKQ
ncbi:MULTISPECIES: acyl carrier protein [Butyricimonas]|uniref:acyl carrier protein n=1 Tax=Butyricimonas TaxID=574697 RepID=UPI001D05F4C4|nr:MULTISPECIES: acyl carrier protein [Butyricimonas]MCB6974644.1 acyl carrier protein [Butyricimonas synergistica]MCG4521386.1 acyl carrier protein [Butyricimonas sp. DFI.6.44]